ncbi:uncharacterized protein LOC130723888 [Lotus japonicus]|uniref:uncharacterized protein LOC130723888 n=1 Tax=Lotus japonicus TaxID=34305 RepID=UPI0025855190|nr:uncharacterized protein LOC130723888 [Lotus japonicus]
MKSDIVLQNVMNGTKIMWNPDIPEVASFRDGFARNGIDCHLPLGLIDGDVPTLSLDEDFLTMFPRKTILDLHSTAEEGIFIVCAKVSGLLEGEKWWYMSCRCHRGVTIKDDMPYCSGCATFVLEVIPRFRIKIEVCEGEDTAIFVLFDADSQHLIQRNCKDLFAGWKGKNACEYPDVIKGLVGKEYLFKVEKMSDHGAKFDDSFKVKKACDNGSVIEKFKHNSQVQTPKKLLTDAFVSKFAGGSNGRHLSDIIAESSNELSEIGANTVSLDDISPVECSSVLSSVGSAGDFDASSSKPTKKMKLRNVKEI